MNKAIITVVGKDTVGIIAKLCMYLSEHNLNSENQYTTYTVYKMKKRRIAGQ